MDGAAERQAGAQEGAPALAGRRLLIVEDSPPFQAALTAMARALGASNVLVDTGAAGVAALAEGGFDLAVIDIDLPDMSGAQVIATAQDGPTALLAVSAHAEPSDAPGADRFEPKPFGSLADFAAAAAAALAARDARRASAG